MKDKCEYKKREFKACKKMTTAFPVVRKMIRGDILNLDSKISGIRYNYCPFCGGYIGEPTPKVITRQYIIDTVNEAIEDREIKELIK